MNHQVNIVNGKRVKVYSLVFITDPDKRQVLLGMKKRGFGCGKFNGFGGKLAINETIEECARREVFEECSLIVNKLEKIAIVVYEFEKQTDSDCLMEVHFFRTDQYTGLPQESDEMRPKWFSLDQIPFDSMWVDDAYWFPYFRRDEHFNGYFLFRTDNQIIYQHLAWVDKKTKIEPIYDRV